MKRLVADNGMVRRMNRQAVINHLRENITASPSQLSKELKISLPTIMRVLDDLGTEGLVAPDGFISSSGGRPPARWRFNGESHAIICVHVMTEETRGVICDLNGRFLKDITRPNPKTGDENTQAVIDMVDYLLQNVPDDVLSVRGIGIGVPSMVRQPEGLVVRTLDRVGWAKLPLRRILAEKFNLPIFVDRERELAVLAEKGFGLCKDLRHVVALEVDIGAGAGILIDGKVYRGGNFAVGEVKWILDDPLISGLDQPLLGHKQSLRFSRGIPKEAYSALARVASAYRAGEFPISDFPGDLLKTEDGAIVSQLMNYTTRAVASLMAIINPQLMILSGSIAQGGDFVLDLLRARIGEDVYELPPIAFSELGENGIILGAAMTVLQETTLTASSEAFSSTG